MIWRRRKSTAPPASRICGRSAKSPASATNTFPAQLTVIEDVCKKYACDCTVKTATKPPQPIEKSTAGASLLAQVIVAKSADHLPLHRQEKIFAASRRGDLAQDDGRLDGAMRRSAGAAVWIAEGGSVPVQGDRDRRYQREGAGSQSCRSPAPDASGRTAGIKDHPVIVYDYTATRERAGPENSSRGYRGYLQADAYGGYDAFFKDPARGLIEVGCWAHYPDSGIIQSGRRDVLYGTA